MLTVDSVYIYEFPGHVKFPGHVTIVGVTFKALEALAKLTE